MPNQQTLNQSRLAPAQTVPAWFVVHTYSGHEAKVNNNLLKRIESFGLKDQIQEVFIPTQEKIEIKEGRRSESKQRLFPGYVLVKMVLSDAAYSCVRHTPGVTGFVGTGSTPTPISEKEVAAIKKYSQQEAPRVEADFSLGEAVKIVDGPFADFVGTVDRINEEQAKVEVLVSIFGRETPVELDFLQVKRL